MIPYIHSDGGRAAAGFRGLTGDCGVRAAAIAMRRPYAEVYRDLAAVCATERPSRRRRGRSHPRTGVHGHTYARFLAAHGWRWVPTMGIGTGATVHLRADELPAGRIITRVSRHYAAVIDRVLHDNHDSSREGTRCVYGYWVAPEGVRP